MSVGSAVFQLAFQLSPIVLTGGLAEDMPGGLLPIIVLTDTLSFATGILGSGAIPSLDDAFAHFMPTTGTQLVNNQVGMYPFANQAVAANAIIAAPTEIGMLMVCPARGPLAYGVKLATMLALKAALAAHNNKGGTYTIIQPSLFATSCIMTAMEDASGGESHQQQVAWRMRFVRPLITLEDAQSVQNSLMSKLTNGTQTSDTPSWSGLSPSVSNPNSVAAPGVIPGTGGLPAANAAPLTPAQSSPLGPI